MPTSTAAQSSSEATRWRALSHAILASLRQDDLEAATELIDARGELNPLFSESDANLLPLEEQIHGEMARMRHSLLSELKTLDPKSKRDAARAYRA